MERKNFSTFFSPSEFFNSFLNFFFISISSLAISKNTSELVEACERNEKTERNFMHVSRLLFALGAQKLYSWWKFSLKIYDPLSEPTHQHTYPGTFMFQLSRLRHKVSIPNAGWRQMFCLSLEMMSMPRFLM